MRPLLLLVLVLASSSPATAGEHDATFAKGFNVAATAVHEREDHGPETVAELVEAVARTRTSTSSSPK